MALFCRHCNTFCSVSMSPRLCSNSAFTSFKAAHPSESSNVRYPRCAKTAETLIQAARGTQKSQCRLQCSVNVAGAKEQAVRRASAKKRNEERRVPS